MKKLFGILLAVCIGMTMHMQTTHAVSATALTKQPEGSVYRFWSPVFQKHLMTMGYEEANLIYTTNAAWQYDGVVFKAFTMSKTTDTSTCPQDQPPKLLMDKCTTICQQGEIVYRFVGKNNAFFYSFYQEAMELLRTNPFWQYEGPVFCALQANSTSLNIVKAYRYYNSSQITHVFTSSDVERAGINSNSAWQLEGAAFSVEAPVISPKQKYINDLITIFISTQSKFQIPDIDMSVEQITAQYAISELALDEAITALGNVIIPDGAAELHAITNEIFVRMNEYVGKVILVVNDSNLSETEMMNQVSDLIDQYVPAIESLITKFDPALKAFANS